MTNWYLTDDDCLQYMRNDGTVFEMIEYLWLVSTDKDTENDYRGCCVVNVSVNMDYLYGEEREIYISHYGYTLEELYKNHTEEEVISLIAECVLEEDAYSDDYVIAEFDNKAEAEAYIKGFIKGTEHKIRVD